MKKNFHLLINILILFLKKYPLNDLCWNYDLNFIFENNSFDYYFLTNIVCESTNG